MTVSTSRSLLALQDVELLARACGPPLAWSCTTSLRGDRIGRVDEHRRIGHRGDAVSRSSSSRFGADLDVELGDAGDVAARPVEARDQAEPHRIAGGREHDRNGRGRGLGRERRRARWSRQSPRPGGEPDRPPAPADGRTGRPPSDIRSPRSGPRHSRLRPDLDGTRARAARTRSAEAPLRNPITGIAGCCARAASGHAAAAPPSSVMNSRRFIRSPRRRGRAAVGRHIEAERLGGLEVDHQSRTWSAPAPAGRPASRP